VSEVGDPTEGGARREEPREGREAPLLVRHEEEAQVGKRDREAGAVGVRKRVETDRVEERVPRSIEYFEEAERVAPNPEDSGEIETLPDGSVSIPVLEEELVVTKRTVVRERVIVRKRTEVEERVIEADLRRERVEVETDEPGLVEDRGA
jgi:uncharacterized protein (TIGR02271 family)